jgi:hypothetical protein
VSSLRMTILVDPVGDALHCAMFMFTFNPANMFNNRKLALGVVNRIRACEFETV